MTDAAEAHPELRLVDPAARPLPRCPAPPKRVRPTDPASRRRPPPPRDPRRCACSSRSSGCARTPRTPSTRCASPPAACAAACVRSARSSTRTGPRTGSARSCAGWRTASARCATARCCSARLERDTAALPYWAGDRADAGAHPGRTRPRHGLRARARRWRRWTPPATPTLVSVLLAAAGEAADHEGGRQVVPAALPPLVAKAFQRLADDASGLQARPAAGQDHRRERRRVARGAHHREEGPVRGGGLRDRLRQAGDEAGRRAHPRHRDPRRAPGRGDRRGVRGARLGSVPGVAADVALTLGVLHGVQRDAVRAARAEFVGIWPEVSAKRLRAWL